MTNDTPAPPLPEFFENIAGPRRPRIALMGEFSAGKSTLANLMIGSDPLPVQVIATQLPPVWISHGSDPAVIVDLEGNETPCDLAALQEISTDETAFIRIQSEEEILKLCDVIDMPGISDPNMASDVWARILPFADGVIWCSPATQAWRQSEASIWENIPHHIQEHSILLLTRGDMLLSEKDRNKVLKRVRGEVEGAFANCLIMSLTQARAAQDDSENWEASGAEPFVSEFMRIIGVLTDRIANGEIADPFEIQGLKQPELPVDTTSQEAVARDSATDRIIPRRPVAKSVRARPAPPPEIEEELSLTPKFS